MNGRQTAGLLIVLCLVGVCLLGLLDWMAGCKVVVQGEVIHRGWSGIGYRMPLMEE
jgi:hypothetical protein